MAFLTRLPPVATPQLLQLASGQPEQAFLVVQGNALFWFEVRLPSPWDDGQTRMP